NSNLIPVFGNSSIDNINGANTTLGRGTTNQNLLVNNVAVVNTVIKTYLCPSDTLPNQKSNGFAKSNYPGNMGNLSTVGSANAFGCASFKGSAQNGVLLNANDNNSTWCSSVASMADGTSNTVMVGEASISTNVSPSNLGNGNFPIWAGGNGGGCNGLTGAGSNLRIMDPTATLNGGADYAFGSRHTGGANFLMGDGGVKFFSNSISNSSYTDTYAALGSRNGGEVVTLP
ncbi:MAG TPA: DUF1559 domain-containing protein, partial [Gemmata sp.]